MTESTAGNQDSNGPYWLWNSYFKNTTTTTTTTTNNGLAVRE